MFSDETLAQLCEMFGDYIDQSKILAAVHKCNNDLEACIETLLNDEGDGDPKELPKNNDKPTEDDWFHFPDVPAVQSTRVLPAAVPTGAIKKTVPPQPSVDATATFASYLKKGGGNLNFGSMPQPQRSTRNAVRRGDEWPSNFASVVDLINKGYRMMVIMRGAPGSGKSYLSRALIDKTLGNSDYRNHIFSSDDYFMVNGVYKHQVERLEDAHRFNQNNVRAKARDGWSPIVVDNTNMRLWEMYAYVQIAADNGYYVEVLEPVTHWRNNSRALATRNRHGVPEVGIKKMLTNYEKLKDVTELFRQCKLEHVLYVPPKMRHFPIVQEDLHEQTEGIQNSCQESAPENTPRETEIKEWATTDWEVSNDALSKSPEASSDSLNLADIPIPKPPRLVTPQHIIPATATSSSSMASEDLDSTLILAVQSSTTDDGGDPEWSWPTTNEISWKPYDEESVDFWTKSDPTGQSAATTTAPKSPQTPRPKRGEQLADQSSFLLSNVTIPAEWRTPENSVGVTPIKVSEKKSERKKSDKKRIALVKHRRGCKNENTSFSEICNLYPLIPSQFLWDLFEKCNGDGDWTANLLLEEQKMYDFQGQPGQSSVDAGAEGANFAFECDCNETLALQVPSSGCPGGGGGGGYDTDRSTVSSGSPRNTMRKKEKVRSEDLQHAKKQLEASFVLGSEHYSNHIQQIRVAKGIIRKEEVCRNSEESEVSNPEEPIKLDPDVLEVTIGVDLIKQLHEVFKDKHSSKSFSVDDITPERTKVFMSTEMAEQLYLSFMDSVYSYREEAKLVTLKSDAQIAKRMEAKQRYPALFSEAPARPSDSTNLKDIIEMEYALSAYRNEVNGWTKHAPQDLAAQMTRQKLVEMFPSVEEKVLAEILHAHDNKFHDTVDVLNNSIPEQLRSQIAREREALLKRAEIEKQKPHPPTIAPTNSSDQGQPGNGSQITGEDAINLHLKTAEECRNLSQHHQELKNECHEKARNAIQRGMAGVAEYYAQIARLHRTKIDMFNSKASNSIMEVHKLTLNNADVLDLHYLHSEEALGCLEIFLADHAGKLKNRQQQYKELFIITGRGLHSADGIPIIKHRVKAMLKELGLRCMELNPGFLKIKLFNNSDMLHRLMMPQC